MDIGTYLRGILALVAVLGLIGAAAWGARRFGLAGGSALPRRQRRLAIAEVLPVDNRRRLVLVRRDAVEHLLLIGGTTDLVVEAAVPAPARAEPAVEQA